MLAFIKPVDAREWFCSAVQDNKFYVLSSATMAAQGDPKCPNFPSLPGADFLKNDTRNKQLFIDLYGLVFFPCSLVKKWSYIRFPLVRSIYPQ